MKLFFLLQKTHKDRFNNNRRDDISVSDSDVIVAAIVLAVLVIGWFYLHNRAKRK